MKKILLIEDDQQQIFYIKLAILETLLEIKENITAQPKKRFDDAVLKSKNLFSFTEVRTCEDAKKIFLKEEFDIVVLDGNILDGSTEKIFPLFEKIPKKVIAHSSSTFFLTKAHLVGFFAIIKSTPYKKLAEKIKEILN